ncbi:MAG: ABC transporter ATP-binding protein [Anaerolineae bacterium]|nr:ABC transporter ATP-binding protein [Anaerolineae bacterium]
MAPDTLIRIQGIKRHFILGDSVVKALDGVDLDIEQGEMMCLMGPSGSGKSTLMNLLGGLDTPDEGTIVVGGRDISALDENELALYRRQMVGFVFQSFNLIPTMTALENVSFPLIFSGTAPAERKARGEELLDMVGLADRMDHKPTELSGGQQQRVAMARALANDPQILLGDEPTGNLDSKTGVEVMEMLRKLNEQGQTIVLVTHDPRVSQYTTRSIHMLDGRIIEEELAPL